MLTVPRPPLGGSLDFAATPVPPLAPLPSRFRPRLFRDDPAHPINDPDRRAAYLQRPARRSRWTALSAEQKRAYTDARREKRRRERENRGGVTASGREVRPFRPTHSGRGARTLVQKGAAEAYRLGYRITDAGELRNPRGRRLSSAPRAGRFGRRFFLVRCAFAGPDPKHPGWRKAVQIPLATFALYSRYGDLAFQPGTQSAFLDGDPHNLAAGNHVMVDRAVAAAIRGERQRTWTLDGSERLAPPAPRTGLVPYARSLDYADVVRWRAEWRRNGGTKTLKQLAAENRVPLSTLQAAVAGRTYKTANLPARLTVRVSPGSVDGVTVRAFRHAVTHLGVPVKDAAARLGKSAWWGYQVMSGRLYAAERTAGAAQTVASHA